MSLYDYMSQSRDPKNMKAFGCVMTEMMDYLVANKPDVAEEMIDKLEAIKWHQYLTPKEAEKIVAGMEPKAPWSREVWKNAMESFGLPLEEMPAYNRCVLWVEMNKIYSDFGEEIAALLGIKENSSASQFLRAKRMLARQIQQYQQQQL